MFDSVKLLIEASGRQLEMQKMTAKELDDGLIGLNLLLMRLSASRNNLYKVTRENFTLTSGTNSYTVKSGGDLDTTIFTKIITAFIRIDSLDSPPLDLLDAEEYADVAQKSFEDEPTALYFERDGLTGYVFFAPTPISAYDCHIWSIKPLAQYTALDDTLGLPPDYEPMLMYNLAVDMGPTYGQTASRDTKDRARHTLRDVRNLNHKPPRARTDVIGGRHYGRRHYGRDFNINSGAYFRR